MTDRRKWTWQYISLHLIMWCLVTFVTLVAYYDNTSPLGGLILHAFLISICGAIPFYISAYVLVPRYLYRRRFMKFILLLLGLVLVMGVLTAFLARLSIHIRFPEEPLIPEYIGPVLNLFIWNELLGAVSGGGLKLMSDRFRIEKRLRETEKEKITTELNFLRSQINPHFLFNVMNTIYFQIDKSNVQARQSVEKLADMLRYQLYECTTDLIDIEKEVRYIRNYVSIQSLRLERGADIKLEIGTGLTGFRIAPLLILPLVENAFKHISHYKEAARNKIHISLLLGDIHTFIIRTFNTYETSGSPPELYKSSGLGIRNLKRRLELLYPGHHIFRTEKTEHSFETILKIRLPDQVPDR